MPALLVAKWRRDRYRKLMLYNVGQEVVLMSHPGRFRIVEVVGQTITIENDSGVRKRVLEQAVRPVPAQA